MNTALIVGLPFSSFRMSSSSHMTGGHLFQYDFQACEGACDQGNVLDLLKAIKASISTISIVWSLTVTVVPEELVFISGRLNLPKHPALPHISSVIGVMVPPIGPVLATSDTIDMRKELGKSAGAQNGGLEWLTYFLVAFVILIDVTSSVDWLTMA